MKTGKPLPIHRTAMRHPDHTFPYWTFFSLDGQRLYSGGESSRIWIWDIGRGEVIGEIETQLQYLFGADFHAESYRLAAGGVDGSARVWNVNTGEELNCIQRHRNTVSAVRFADDGRLLVTASHDRTVRLSDGQNGARIGRLKRIGPRIHGLAAAADGSCFSAIYLYGVHVWNRTSEDMFHYDGLYYHGGEGQSDIALSRDGRLLWVTFRKEPVLRVWDLSRGGQKPIRTVDVSWAAFSLAVSRDETRLAVGLRDEIVLIRADRYEVLHRWQVPFDKKARRLSSVDQLSFSQDGRMLSSTSPDGGIWLWAL